MVGGEFKRNFKNSHGIREPDKPSNTLNPEPEWPKALNLQSPKLELPKQNTGNP